MSIKTKNMNKTRKEKPNMEYTRQYATHKSFVLSDTIRIMYLECDKDHIVDTV